MEDKKKLHADFKRLHGLWSVHNDIRRKLEQDLSDAVDVCESISWRMDAIAAVLGYNPAKEDFAAHCAAFDKSAARHNEKVRAQADAERDEFAQALADKVRATFKCAQELAAKVPVLTVDVDPNAGRGDPSSSVHLTKMGGDDGDK